LHIKKELNGKGFKGFEEPILSQIFKQSTNNADLYRVCIEHILYPKIRLETEFLV